MSLENLTLRLVILALQCRFDITEYSEILSLNLEKSKAKKSIQAKKKKKIIKNKIFFQV